MDVVFRNIYFEKSPCKAHLNGYDALHMIGNVIFENIFERDENGFFKPVADIAKLNLEQKFTRNIKLVVLK